MVNQVSGGLMSCNGGSVVNCGSFWVSNINTVQTNIYKDTHRPDTAVRHINWDCFYGIFRFISFVCFVYYSGGL